MSAIGRRVNPRLTRNPFRRRRNAYVRFRVNPNLSLNPNPSRNPFRRRRNAYVRFRVNPNLSLNPNPSRNPFRRRRNAYVRLHQPRFRSLLHLHTLLI